MRSPSVLLASLALVVLGVYLFVSAPPPLPAGNSGVGTKISIKELLTLVAKENDVIRTLYTREIVGKGKKVGLSFSERWRDKGVHAGPLPALFLREVSKKLRRKGKRLGLFLGSPFPIAASNRFQKSQQKMFARIARDRTPVFFYNQKSRQHTAMFPDFASVQACVSCHNKHPDSPKNDWKLHDVMGATTWTYPKAKVTLREAFDLLQATRSSFRFVYEAYVEKAKRFPNRPRLGNKWPKEGLFLPTPDVFMKRFSKLASTQSLTRLLQASLRSTP